MIIVLRQSLEFRCHQEAKIVYFVPLETVSLADAAHREVQRRSEASVDHAAVLPPDVVAVLTMFDASEREKEEGHNNAHIRFADSITRFFDKLRTEETKYNNRMEELQVRKILNFINEIRTALREFKTVFYSGSSHLMSCYSSLFSSLLNSSSDLISMSLTFFLFQGALNPEAEAAVTDRFQQAKARLRSELQDQLQSRTEQLDEQHSGLEYVRNKAEISALEAKVTRAV